MQINLWNRLKRMLGLTYRVTAPPIPSSELITLRAHIDEAKNDPDYDVVWSYQTTWGADLPDSHCCFSQEYPVSADELPAKPSDQTQSPHDRD